MKKKWMLPIFCLLLFCLFSSAAYAETDEGSENTETLTLTEENRYDSVYYQEPEELYPAVSDGKVRSSELSLEDYVVNALENFETQIDVTAYKIPTGEAATKYFQILNNHPSLFYVVSAARWSYNPSTNMVASYKIQYTDTEENVKAQKADFEREVEKALNWVDSSMTSEEKALAVHDYLVLECEYDKERLDNETLPDVSHSAYGALVNKIAVCDGYAKAYSSILEELGISSTVVSSGSMNHAWNQVSINGEWYHVDATWDDPTWDCVGRVGHDYFLLSDAAISDDNHEHVGWDGGFKANSNTYDNEFWSGVTSAFCYQNGSWYYSLRSEGSLKTDLVKRAGSLLNASGEILYTEQESWNNYLGAYMFLDVEPIKNEIYFNTRTGIYKLDETGKPTVIYEPEIPAGQLIFGFTVRGAQLCYALQQTPNLESKQMVSSYTIEELQLPQITGVTAEDVAADYDGTAKQIIVKGIQEGDRVTYKHEDGMYRVEQPELKNAGAYQIRYKVEREGYEAYIGTVSIVIQKATPKYTVPSGLQGSSGSLLSQVKLPEGFAWESESAAMKLREEGEITGYVSYTPDSQNYETVSHIPVKVTVVCPGHQYIEKVTIAATTTQKGSATCTCELCGNTYTKELDLLKPNAVQKPEKVSGLKVSKAATNSLQFSWTKVTGAKYRLVLYKGSKAVSTVYTGNSSYTCKKLQAATLYTAKVTSYVESNGTKVYAASAASVKAATTPAKAKLVSVKKKGSTKMKITWKKVTGADGYEISMRTGKGRYKSIKTITKGKTVTFTKSGLKKGKSYSFRVRAYKKVGSKKTYGSYSNVKTIKLK